MEPLKDLFYSSAYYELLATALKRVYPSLPLNDFLHDCLDSLNSLELKERMNRATEVTAKYLPDSYPSAIEILLQLPSEVKSGFSGMFLPDFVSKYGLADVDISLHALHHFTQYSSSEFGIRPFIRQDIDKVLPVLIAWSKDENHHVRRMASEGSRPTLPWSFHLNEIMKDPEYTWPILHNLRNDDSLYVRKSVANHLNDVSKKHPQWLIEHITPWQKESKYTSWIVKQALRTLVKKGDTAALELLDFQTKGVFEPIQFSISPNTVSIGEKVFLDFEMKVVEGVSNLNIDFQVHYCKKNDTSIKVFKGKVVPVQNGEHVRFQKNLSLADLSTRTHYPGIHVVDIMANGQIIASASFTLT